MFRIGVDIGGTFTDFAIWRRESDGYVDIGSHKAPTSRPDFARAVIEGIDAIVREHEIPPNEPILIVHGTTVSTNAIIERSQPPIALVTTAGYRDILNLARLRLEKPIDMFNRRPPPLVPREHVFEVTERVLADGSVDTPLDEACVLSVVQSALDRGATGIAICFLHAHKNPMHERRAVEIARERFTDIEIMASHEVWPQQSEYERAVVTLLNVYVKGMMDAYLGEIDRFLQSSLPGAKLYITKSNGGIMSANEARLLPIHTLLSGPAAGVTAASALGRQLGLDRVLTFDMGGTSTDVSLIDQGRATVTAQAEVGDFPLLMPVTAIEAMGAGGGSIIWLDGRVLKVGPQSASSRPGPACYGTNGTKPTLTDAYLISGYLSDKGLLGGKLPLYRDLARQALLPIADALGTDVEGAAESAIQVATSTMLAKILPFLARQGFGPTDLSLLIYGGAGGVHGPILADEVGIRRIVVPRIPSVFCAYGGLVSDLVHDGVRTMRGAAPASAALRDAYVQLERQGEAWLERQSFAGQVTTVERLYIADMRYSAQSFSIPVDITCAMASNDPVGASALAFHAEHERLFGHASRQSTIAIDDLRLKTIGRQAKPSPEPLPRHMTITPTRPQARSIRLGGGTIADVPVHAWSELPAGWSSQGPAIIEQDLSTVLVPPTFLARVGEFGDLDLIAGA